MTTLNTTTRRALKRRLIREGGESAAGLNDAALLARCEALGLSDVPGETPEAAASEGGGTSPGGEPLTDDALATLQSASSGSDSGESHPGAEGAAATSGDGQESDSGSGSDSDGDGDGDGDSDGGSDGEEQDADDNGDKSAPADDASDGDAERRERQQQERQQRREQSDPMTAGIRDICNEEIDGREYETQLSETRAALSREIHRRRKLARRMRRFARKVAQQRPAAPASVPSIQIRVPGEAPKTIKSPHPLLPQFLLVLTDPFLHPLLVGPAGSGKSTLVEQAAEAIGAEFWSVGAVHQKYELTGYCDANGVYQETAFYEVFKNGGVMLWDEYDASIASATVAFNGALANQVYTFPNKERVRMHPKAYFAAAANTVGTGATRQYSGRNILDGATLDRWQVLHVDYDEDLEDRITLGHFAGALGLDDTSDLTEEQQQIAAKWIAEVRKLRAHATAQNWSSIISPRASISGARMMALGLPLDMVREATLYKHLSADQRRQLGIPLR